MVTIEVVAIVDGIAWLSMYVDSGDDGMDVAYACCIDCTCGDDSIFDALRDVLQRSGAWTCGHAAPCQWCASLDVPASNELGVDLCDCDGNECNCDGCANNVCGCACSCSNRLDMSIGVAK